MPTPIEQYQRDLDDKDFVSDPAQEQAVRHLQRLYYRILKRTGAQPVMRRITTRLLRRNRRKLKGLYFWGGVGRGKTYLVDCFYDCLPIENKKRIHFHRFMQEVHGELKQLSDVERPLQIVAERLTGDTRVLCFDEFHVSDITDAMLLAGLLKAFFDRDVVLVATSNQHPDDLYRGGLQRERFLPAIELLKQHTDVVNVDAGVDYRLQFLDHAEIYHTPLDAAANVMLEEDFNHLSPDTGSRDVILKIEGRDIHAVRHGDGVVWFDFDALCDGPRGAADYIEIARQFQTVLLSDIPVMDDHDNDKVKRFMILVDEFYDHNVKLIITAAAHPGDLYNGKRLAEEFRRTISRLEEMRTHDYLAKCHIP